VRSVCWLAAAATTLTLTPAAAPAATAVHLLVQPRHSVLLRSRPNGPVLLRAPAVTPWSSPTTFAALERHGNWLRVVSDLLPNNGSAWLAADGAPVRSTRWLVRVDLSERRLTVLRGTAVVRQATVAVGASASPTPTGTFSITDKLETSRFAGYSTRYGRCVLALSGHQTRLPVGWSGDPSPPPP
jgi:hypothetical protein